MDYTHHYVTICWLQPIIANMKKLSDTEIEQLRARSGD